MKVLIGTDVFLDSDILLDSDIQLMGALKVIAKDSIAIEDAIEERSIASFIVIDMRGLQKYQKGQPVSITSNDETVVIYNGIVEDVVEKRIEGTEGLYHSIRCVDNNYKADKRIIARGYQNMRVGDIVQDIFNTKLEEEGVEIGEIHLGDVAVEATFNYIPVSDALNSLAEKAGFWWNIGHDNKLYFVSRETFTYPNIIRNTDMERGSIRVLKGNPQYRNQQYVKGGKTITDTQTQIELGDGEKQTFTVGFDIAKVPTVEISLDYNPLNPAWIPQTIGIKGLEEGKQWYWSKGSNSITQELQDTPLRKDIDRVRIAYQGEIGIVAITYNENEILARKAIEEIGTGIVEDVIDDKSISTREAAFELANTQIKKYAMINTTVSFRTLINDIKVGQIIPIDLPLHDIHEEELLVDRITVTTEGNLEWYEIHAVKGPSNQSWSKFFYTMSTLGREFVVRENIQENQTLIILEQFTKTWNASEAPNIFKGTSAGDSTFPSTGTFPMFAEADRVKYLAWYVNGVEAGRKEITTRVNSTDQIFTLTFVNSIEANADISHVGWFGGIGSTNLVGTGIEIDKQVYVKVKTELEAMQIEKTDILNFTPQLGQLELTPAFLNERESRIKTLETQAQLKISNFQFIVNTKIDSLLTKSQ